MTIPSATVIQIILMSFGSICTVLLGIIAFGIRRVLSRLDEMVTRKEWELHNAAMAEERASIRKDVEHNRERTEAIEDKLMAGVSA
jgi:hypothetical protein